MIGPGGLLLVVPHIYAVPVSVLWVSNKMRRKKVVLFNLSFAFFGS